MIPLFLLSLFAFPCLAVETGRTGDQDDVANPITRWVNSYKRIHNDRSGEQIELDQLKSLIGEMSSIERTDQYKLGLKPLIESGGYRVKNYRHLIDRSYEKNIIHKEDATIIDLLMQTFDYNANLCTSEYLAIMNEILEEFKDLSIARALKESRELQMRNCWLRLIKPVVANNMIIGSRTRSLLDRLIADLYPNATELIHISSDKCSTEFNEESVRIAGQLGKSMRDLASKEGAHIDTAYLEGYLQRFVRYPCSLFIDEMRQTIAKVFEFLKFADNKRDFLDPSHTLILNEYLMCDMIFGAMRSISTNFTKFATGQASHFSDSTKVNEPMDMMLGKLSGGRSYVESRKQAAETDLKSGEVSIGLKLGSTNEDESDNLITQNILSDDEIKEDDDHESVKVRFAPRPEDYVDFETEAPGGKRLIELSKGVGRAQGIRYPATWSDGSKSMVTRPYLLTYWPDELQALVNKQARVSRARYLKKWKGQLSSMSNESGQDKATMPPLTTERPRKRRICEISDPESTVSEFLDDGEPSNEATALNEKDPTRTVVKIELGVGRGRHIEYPTIWSDGVKTMEKKKYLVNNWFLAWYEYLHERKIEHQAAYEARSAQRMAQKYNIDPNRPTRPRIPLLATQTTTERPENYQATEVGLVGGPTHNSRQPHVFQTILDSSDLGFSTSESLRQAPLLHTASLLGDQGQRASEQHLDLHLGPPNETTSAHSDSHQIEK